MILYKNVDICDLESILEKGILSLDASGNKWMNDNRANNPTDRVYLFEPIGPVNSFTCYGAALLKVDIDAAPNELTETDAHKADYKEYTAPIVSPEHIKAIYIPDIFKDRLKDHPLFRSFIFVPISATNSGREATTDELKQFAKTAELNTIEYGFFRGKYDNGDVFDLHDFHYFIPEN